MAQYNDINLVFIKETFEDVFTSKSLMRDWYLVAGNHDHNGNVTAQIEYTNKTQRWYVLAIKKFYVSFTEAESSTDMA